ncbi:MAG: hypothetical protein ACYCW6_08250, partial [Candidatus Xenobia bacterium]
MANLIRLSESAVTANDPCTVGTLLIIGGAEDKKGDKKILRKFVELAGGEQARVGVLATATRKNHEAADRYCQIFRELGVKEAQN